MNKEQLFGTSKDTQWQTRRKEWKYIWYAFQGGKEYFYHQKEPHLYDGVNGLITYADHLSANEWDPAHTIQH